MNLDGILCKPGHPGTTRRVWATPTGKHNAIELLKLVAQLVLVIAALVILILLLKHHDGAPIFE